ncbi:hypothetical protein L195_g022017 [Trifolium pratense]|uniref:Uncharacterized protein n=1 Tax=Trifolium pratense TaxID=57577 RepID=A0A2K3N6W2_TRIPR|nr:hypothetical protein L195_g022017 [Trifolium pratense]
MANSSQFNNNDTEDVNVVVQTSPQNTVLSPARNTDLQILPEIDSRDGHDISWASEDGDLVVLTEKQSGKHP